MGPLQGVKIIEFAGVGPGRFCAMILADMGAQVSRLVKGGALALPDPTRDLLDRGRHCVRVDPRIPDGATFMLDLGGRADGLLEGFRPGVMERLGLGPPRESPRGRASEIQLLVTAGPRLPGGDIPWIERTRRGRR